MRVVPLDRPWKGHQPIVRITFCIEFFLSIGWRTFIWWKICQSAAHFWFGLRDVGILYSRAVIQRTIAVSPAFLDPGLAEKIVVWAQVNRDPHKQEVGFIFAWSGSELWTLIKYSRSKIKNKKTYSYWCAFQGLSNGTTLMQIQSAGRYL